jgi:uncharacterized protein YbjT (DUF2867 family)
VSNVSTSQQEISMNPSILVVGASGSIGSELVRQLAAAGHRPRALVRDQRKGAAIRHLAEPVLGDLATPATLAPAFRGVERVFVLAPPTPELETLTTHALDAAVAAGAKRIVYLSGDGAGELDDSHFRAHAANERRVASLGVDWTVLRSARFMNYTPFVWGSVFHNNLLLEPGDGAMTVCDPVDVAAVGVVTLTTEGHAGQTYKLTSEDSLTTRELADRLSKATGRKLATFRGDTEALRAALVACGAPEVYAPLMANYFAAVAAGFWRTTDTVARVLRRAPRSYAQWLDRNLPDILLAHNAAPTL